MRGNINVRKLCEAVLFHRVPTVELQYRIVALMFFVRMCVCVSQSDAVSVSVCLSAYLCAPFSRLATNIRQLYTRSPQPQNPFQTAHTSHAACAKLETQNPEEPTSKNQPPDILIVYGPEDLLRTPNPVQIINAPRLFIRDGPGWRPGMVRVVQRVFSYAWHEGATRLIESSFAGCIVRPTRAVGSLVCRTSCCH